MPIARSFLVLKGALGKYLFAQLCFQWMFQAFFASGFCSECAGMLAGRTAGEWERCCDCIFTLAAHRASALAQGVCSFQFPGQPLTWNFQSGDRQGCLHALCSFVIGPDADIWPHCKTLAGVGREAVQKVLHEQTPALQGGCQPSSGRSQVVFTHFLLWALQSGLFFFE